MSLAHPPSAAYMRQWIRWALVQMMACHLFGAKLLSKPMLVVINWTLKNKLQWNFDQNAKLFIHENASENNICKMAAILSRGRWVNSWWPRDAIWRQESRSTLVQVMACCLTAPSHYLNQCWLIITKVQWCSSEGNFAWDITAISH